MIRESYSFIEMFCTISVLYLTSQILISGSQAYERETEQFSLVHAARYMGILLLYRSRIDIGEQVVVFAKITEWIGGKIRRSVADPEKNLYVMHGFYIIYNLKCYITALPFV